MNTPHQCVKEVSNNVIWDSHSVGDRLEAKMRWSLRFALSASVLLIILLLFLKSHLEDLWSQYSVGSYISHSWRNTFQYGIVDNNPAFGGEPGDKVIVMAKLEKENTDWVTEHLPEYVLSKLIGSIY